MSKNFWGNLEDLDVIRTPRSILKEQAARLGKATKHILIGEVDETSGASQFRYALEIRVPDLNDYVYTVLTVNHDVELYPVTVSADKPNVYEKCDDEKEFLGVIEAILSSKDVRRVVEYQI